MPRGNVANLTNAGKGRPTGSKNRISKNMADTLKQVWEAMQADPETSLLAQAQANPQWFYELCRGMFPKDLFIEADMNLSSMSPAEIKAEIVDIIKADDELYGMIQNLME